MAEEFKVRAANRDNFLMASENCIDFSSICKEVAFADGEIKNFVPENVIKMFKKNGRKK